MDDCLVHSSALEQHLLNVAEVLEIFCRRKVVAFFINSAAFFIGAHPRLPLSAPPVDGAGCESPALYARRMRS